MGFVMDCRCLHLIRIPRCVTVVVSLVTTIIYSVAIHAGNSELACQKEEAFLSQRSVLPEGKSVSTGKWTFNDACFISTMDGHHHRTVIDTRTSDSFSRLHTLNSINLPAHQLVAKQQLASQPLLIVSESHDRFLAGRLCDRLINSGFSDVRILLGGIRALIAEGRTTNKPGGFNELSGIDAKDTLTELFQNQINLVATSQATVESLPELSAQFDEVLDLNDRSNTFNRVMSLSSDARFPLVVLGSEADYKALRGLLNGELPPNLYLVYGGAAAFKKYIRSNEQIQMAMKAVPNRYKCS